MHHIMDYHGISVTRIQFGKSKRGLFCMALESSALSIVNLHSKNIDLERINLRGHTGKISDFCFIEDDRIIVSSSADQLLIVWDVASGEAIEKIRFSSRLNALSSHPINDKVLACGAHDGRIYLVVFGNTWKQYKVESCQLYPSVTSLSFNHDGTIVYSGDSEGRVLFVKLTMTGERVSKFECIGAIRVGQSSTCSLHYKMHRYANWKQSTMLVVVMNDVPKILNLLDNDVSDGTVLAELPLKVGEVPVRISYCPLASTKNSCIAVGSGDGTLYLYELTLMSASQIRVRLVNQLAGHSSAITDVAWSADESLLATSDIRGVVIAWKNQHT